MSDTNLSKLFNSMNSGVAVYDAQDDGADFIFVDLNQAGERISRIRREQVLGKSILELFPAVKEMGLFQALQDAWKTGNPQHVSMTRYQDERISQWVDNRICKLPSGKIMAIYDDITELKMAQDRERLARRVLELLNHPKDASESIRDILQQVQQDTGIEAVGIRLREGDGFSYNETNGFSSEFVNAERCLCEYDDSGKIVCDETGAPVLECMCGNILRGRTDPLLPFFTEGGSFWSNNTTELLASTTEEDRQARTRNRCDGEGYESVALIPLRSNDEIIGLLQFNDRRPDRFNLAMIQFYEGLGASIGIALNRNRAEKMLLEQEKKYRALYENMLAGCCIDEIVYKDGKAVDYRVLDINPAFERITGLGRSQVVGFLATQLYGMEKPPFFDIFAKVAETGEPTSFEGYFPPLKKHLHFMVSCPARGRFSNIITDITDRKRIEEELKFKNVVLSTQGEASIDGILMVDENARILSCNRRFVEMWGIPKTLIEAKIDEPVLQFVTAQMADPEAFLRQVQYLYENQQERSQDELILANGRIVDRYSAPMFGDDGKYYGRVWYFRDITDRKQAEEALLKSEKQYRTLFESSHDAIMTLFPPDWKFTSANASTVAMFGTKDEKEFISLGPWEVSPERQPDGSLSADKAKCMIMTAMEQGSHFFEWTHQRVGGDPFPATVLLNRVEFGEQTGLQATVRDITKSKLTEEALRESEGQLRLALNAAHAIAWVGELAGDSVTEIGPVAEVFGKPAGYRHTNQASFLQDVHPEDRAHVIATLQAGARGETNEYSMEFRVPLADGGIRWLQASGRIEFDSAGKPTHVRGITRNITERKLAEEELQASRKIIEDIINSISVRVFWKDMNLVFLGCNTAFARDAGFAEPKDIIGKDDYQMGWRDQAELYRRDDRQVIESGCPKLLIEEPQTTPDGKEITLLTNKIPLRNPKGEICGVLATYIDITERKQTEKEREKLETQLLQAQKMESVARLAGGVAHDFNNMLSVIIGRAEMALAKLDSVDPDRGNLQEIITAGRRSAELTSQLLAFARKQVIDPKVLDLNDTIAGMLKMLRRLIGENIDLLWQPAANLWPVKMDPSQVDQMLANLVVNARDAIDGVGKVTIKTEKAEIDAAYCAAHADAIPGRYVMLAVSDDGCGMEQEILAQIFEPFFTTKEVGEGTGLGLSTIFGIVKQNFGFINVYSEPGKGTTFQLYLPRTEEKVSESDEPTAAEMPTGTETILLVEDEGALLELAEIQLAELGYTVLTAGRPHKAIDLAKAHQGEIHLLMTDVVMPEMSGRELLKQVAPLRPEIKSLFMSGYTANVIAHQGVLDQGVQFLQKPFSHASLAMKVRETLDKK